MEKEIQQKQSFFDKQITVANAVVFFGVVLLLGVGIGAGSDSLKQIINENVAKVAPSGDLSKKDYSLYWDVYNQLQNTYVDPSKLKTDEMFYGSIKGMVDAIGDSPTSFLDPKETKDYQNSQSGAYSGIGAVLDFVEKSVIVVAPFEGSPAAQAGIEARDVITHVDEKSTANKTLSEVVTEIRGEAGTKVKITILRPRENYKKYTFDIVRGNVYAPSIEAKAAQDGIAVVKISRFTDATMTQWVSKWNGVAEDVARQYKNGAIKGLIIDLRNNPGGYFDAAVVLAGDFLPKGSVVAYQRDRTGADQTFSTVSTPRLEKIPVTILINGSSASASEIFAGSMKFYKRATIMGEDSYGKGTAQVILPISDGSTLHVTVSKWLLPDKSWLNPENTIKPDKEVVIDYTLRAKGVDNQMDEAVKGMK